MRFAVVGDSFTEGVGDELADGYVRGWSDLVAQTLANVSGEPISYSNFAIRGRLLEPIVNEQIPAALALDPPPTLLTLNGGGNDMLRPGMETSRLIALIEKAVVQCQEAGINTLLLAGADPSSHLPFGKTIKARGDALTDALHILAENYNRPVADVWRDEEIKARRYWSPDRLHLNALGHRRAATIIVEALGYSANDVPDVDATAPSHEGQSQWAFYSEHLTPWMKRRLRGESSGDGRTGKYEQWTTIAPPP